MSRTIYLDTDGNELDAEEEMRGYEMSKKPARPTEPASRPSGYYDEHYAGRVQPIELMQAQMAPKAFRGFLLGNIIKYSSRIGKKDDALEEAVKIRRYADWLVQNEKGETIDPRK